MASIILRAPPFPISDPDIAAISVAIEQVGEVASENSKSQEALDTLLAGMAESRVGGAFWGARPLLSDHVTRWAMPETLVEAQALTRGLQGNRADLAVTLPDDRWARRAASDLRARGCCVLVGPHDPWHLLAHVDEVIVGDTTGEAPVLALAAGRRMVKVDGTVPSVTALRAAAWQRLLDGVRYRDPFSNGAAIPALGAVAILTFWREELLRNASLVSACAIAPWKRRNIGRMLWNGAHPVRFRLHSGAALNLAKAQGGEVAVWAAKAPSTLIPRAAGIGVPVAFVEDGFIRSVGLGSDCVPPQSIAVDRQRPHYDPSGPSDLETMIAQGGVSPELELRARKLIDRLIASGLGKYGGSAAAAAAPIRIDRRTVLVTGQVEDDASVVAGGAGVAGNLELLRRARAIEPDAYLIYRPHPDVEAAHRKGMIPDRDALRCADQVDRETPLPILLEQCATVHVLTSLAGFEALLRGKHVVTHGTPFYSGWGLTQDMGPTITRRNRRVTVEALFACAILRYPRYLDPRTMLPCPAEILVDRLIANEVQPASLLTRVRRLRRFTVLHSARAK